MRQDALYNYNSPFHESPVQQNGFHTNGPKYAKQIRVATTALERASDNYNYWTSKEIHELLKDKRIQDRLSEEDSKKLTRLSNLEEKLVKQDLELFANIFVKHSRGWWD